MWWWTLINCRFCKCTHSATASCNNFSYLNLKLPERKSTTAEEKEEQEEEDWSRTKCCSSRISWKEMGIVESKHSLLARNVCLRTDKITTRVVLLVFSVLGVVYKLFWGVWLWWVSVMAVASSLWQTEIVTV